VRVMGALAAPALALVLIGSGFTMSAAAHAATTNDIEPPPSPMASVLPSVTPSALPSTTPTPSPVTPSRPADKRVYAIGDSVMLGAKSCLEKLGYTVDAQGSRRASAVAMELGLRHTKLPRRVVVHTGTNGGATVADFERIVRAIGPGHEIVLVTVQLPDHSKYSYEDRTNQAIATVAKRFPFVHVADWNSVSDERSGLTYGDGIHLPPAGCRAFSSVVASALRNT